MLQNALKKFRDIYHLSQMDLAIYLGITRSLLSLVEKDIRSLPTAALVKFSELERQLAGINQNKKRKTALPEEKINARRKEAIKKIKYQCLWHERQKALAEQELEAMIETEKNMLAWKSVMEQTLKRAENADTLRYKWLQVQRDKVEDRLLASSHVEQEILNNKIELNAAAAEIYRLSSERLNK